MLFIVGLSCACSDIYENIVCRKYEISLMSLSEKSLKVKKRKDSQLVSIVLHPVNLSRVCVLNCNCYFIDS